MSAAIIETSGNGRVTGAWVDIEDDAPDVAFIDETGQLMAEKLLGDVVDTIGTDPGTTWRDFLVILHERQNHLTIERVWLDEWPGTAAQLLEVAQAAQEAGEPLASVRA